MKPLCNVILWLTVLLLQVSSGLNAQNAPAYEWVQCYGGSKSEYLYDMISTPDSGFILAGYTDSKNSGDVTGNHGESDVWIVKINAVGGLEWQECFGGSDDDHAYSIVQTNEGGYSFAATTWSTDDDVNGNHGNSDIWVVSLDASGNLLWQKCLGGSENDYARKILQLSDGGYAVIGATSSTDGDVSQNYGNTDFWLVRLDKTGNLLWEKNFGSEGNESNVSMIQTTNHEFLICGKVDDISGDVTNVYGNYDIWLAKIDSTGNLLWQHNYGGSEDDQPASVIARNNGSYTICGYTYSSDFDVSLNKGHADYWLFTVDSSGGLLWEKTYGGSGWEWAKHMLSMPDGGYLANGYTNSEDGDVSNPVKGGYDIWAVRFDSTGMIQWENCFGGNGGVDYGTVSVIDDANTIYLGCYGYSLPCNHGINDYFVFKLYPECDVYSAPNFTFTYAGTSFQFTDLSQDAYDWFWDFGDGITSTLQNPAHQYATTGNYTVCLQTSNDCNADTFCTTVTTCDTLLADFDFSFSTLTVDFTDQSLGEIVTYEWDFGDDTMISNDPAPSHSYTHAGIYNMTLTITDSCGNSSSHTDTVDLCAFTTLNADFGYSQNGSAFILIPGYEYPANYHWDLGNGDTLSGDTVQYYYQQEGSYNICLIVSDECIVDTTCQTVTAIDLSGTNVCWWDTSEQFQSVFYLTPNFIATTSTGDAVILTALNDSILIKKYAADGGELWRVVIDSPGFIIRPQDLKTGAGDFIYLCASLEEVPNSKSDWLTCKLNNNGQIIWTRYYLGSAGYEIPYSLELDHNNNVIVAGERDSSYGYPHIIKYDPDGTVLWQSTLYVYEVSNFSDVAVSSDGDIYATGWSPSFYNGIVICKYSPYGSLLWTSTEYPSSRSNLDVLITLSNAGQVAVGAINFEDGCDCNTFTIIQIDTSGNTLHEFDANCYGDYGYRVEILHSLETDDEGNVYFAADVFAPESPNNYRAGCVGKLSPAGDLLWDYDYFGTSGYAFVLADARVTSTGDVYFTGSGFDNYSTGSQPPSGGAAIELVKLNSNGNLVWIKDFDAGFNRTLARSLALDSAKNIFITGFYDTDNADTLLVVKYCNSCTSFPEVSITLPQDTFCYSDPPVTLSGGFPLGGVYSGNGVINGAFDPANAGLGSHLIIYTYEDSLGCAASDSQLVFVDVCTHSVLYEVFDLKFEIFPNPVLDFSTIHLSLPENSMIKIELSDASGRIIGTVAEGVFSAGNHEIDFAVKGLPKGIYLMRLVTQSEIRLQKLIIQ